MFGPHSGSARASVPVPALPAPYGAAELRALAPRHTAQGLATASLLAVVLISAASALRSDQPEAAPHGRLTMERWYTPPSVQPPATSVTPAMRPPKSATGTPTPVPDVRQPETPSFSRVASTGSGEGDEPADGSVSGGDGTGDLTPMVPLADPPPAPPVPSPPVEPPPPAPEVLEIAAVMPTVLDAPVPVYPALARQAGIEGRVIVRVRVSREGAARSVTIVRSDHALLDEAAREAVSRWRFRPGMQDGKPVDVWMTIPVRFRLRERS